MEKIPKSFILFFVTLLYTGKFGLGISGGGGNVRAVLAEFS